jgi:hypothetical protein
MKDIMGEGVVNEGNYLSVRIGLGKSAVFRLSF